MTNIPNTPAIAELEVEVAELRAAVKEKARLVEEREMALNSVTETNNDLRREFGILTATSLKKLTDVTRSDGKKSNQYDSYRRRKGCQNHGTKKASRISEHSNQRRRANRRTTRERIIRRLVLVRQLYIRNNNETLPRVEVRIGRWRGALVAVKIFHDILEGDRYRTLFHREMEICASVRHPNVVSVCGVTTAYEMPLRIISDLLEGSLCDVITATPFVGGELTLKEKIDLGIGFVAGLSYLHRLLPTPILHGDIRSTNVLVTATMEAQVGDLGSARLADASLSAGPQSPEYIAPERNEVHGNTAKADVYSSGVTLAELMTGKEPNQKERHSQMGMIRHDEIRDLCLQMIDDTPAKRPEADACLEVLQAVCSTSEYKGCPPKRLVRGKARGHGRVILTDRLEELG